MARPCRGRWRNSSRVAHRVDRSASAAWGSAITLPDTYALVGPFRRRHAGAAVAGYLADDDAMDNLVGIVMLDGVEPNGRTPSTTRWAS